MGQRAARHRQGARRGDIRAIPWPEVAAPDETLMAKNGGWCNCIGWLWVASRGSAARLKDEACSSDDGGARVRDLAAAPVGGSVW
jgi:hypothetical protein